MNPRDQIAQAMMQQTPQIPGASLMPQMGQMPQMPAMGMMGAASGMTPPTPAAPSPFMAGAQQGAMQMGGAAPGRIPPQQQVLGGATPTSFPGLTPAGLPDQSSATAQSMALTGGRFGQQRAQPQLDPFSSLLPTDI